MIAVAALACVQSKCGAAPSVWKTDPTRDDQRGSPLAQARSLSDRREPILAVRAFGVQIDVLVLAGNHSPERGASAKRPAPSRNRIGEGFRLVKRLPFDVAS
jgi:hypothetical protein